MIPQFKVYMDPDAPYELIPTLQSGFIGQGPKVDEFEENLGIYLDAPYVVTVNSATSGLMLALQLAGVKRGDSVISTPMTCSATNEAIALVGAHIVWADVNEYGNIDPDSVKDIIHTGNHGWAGIIKAIMAVDWGGLPCDYNALRESEIPIIEDAAHAFGAQYLGTSVSRFGGDFVVYSFQAIKHLTTGDGGAVTMHLESDYERAKLLRWYGLDRTSANAMRSRQDIKELGWKFHMNDIAASIGLTNLRSMDWLLDQHRKNAEFYDEELAEFRPDWPEGRQSSFWQYTIHVREPLEFETYAKDNGFVASQVHRRNDEYSIFHQYHPSREGRTTPGLDDFARTMMCIPCGWWMTREDLLTVAEAVKKW